MTKQNSANLPINSPLTFPAGFIPGGRLTLSSGSPVLTTDISGATAVYYTPYNHAQVPLYDGTRWQTYEMIEPTYPLSSLLNATNYDVFIYYSGSALALETVAWSTDTARGTTLQRIDGLWLKGTDVTRLYLGTIRTSVAGQCEDSISKRFVWNQYNRVDRTVRRFDSTTSWTYSTASWRAANNNTANRVQIVCGQNEDPIALTYGTRIDGSVGGIGSIGFGLDSATAPTGMPASAGNMASTFSVFASFCRTVGLGYHYIQALELTNAGTVTFYGNNQFGLEGVWKA